MLDRPELLGTRGAVSSTHWLASAAGTAVFDLGGNAFDAAVATALVSRSSSRTSTARAARSRSWSTTARRGDFVLCGQGPAPAAATPEAFGDLGARRWCPAAACSPAVVPGAFGALDAAAARPRPLELRDGARARDRLRRGRLSAAARGGGRSRCSRRCSASDWTGIGRGLPAGRAARRGRGRRLRNRPWPPPTSASSPRRRRPRAAARSRSTPPRRVLPGVRRRGHRRVPGPAESLDSPAAAHGGLLTGRRPGPAGRRSSSRSLRTTAANVPRRAWCQGPVFLQQLAPARGVRPGGDGPRRRRATCTRSIECAKLAFADREAWYGDPEFTDVPLGAAVGRVRRRARARWSGERASPSCARVARRPVPRLPDRCPPRPTRTGAPQLARAGSGEPAVKLTAAERAATPATSTSADREGNMVVAHAERRLAAELAGHPRARLPARHPRPDGAADPGAARTRSRRASGRGPP